MIGLALASHTFLNELEDRRCKKLGHRSTPDQPHKHCSQCFEAIRTKKKKSKSKRFLPAMLKSQDAPKEQKFDKTKQKSPSITSSSSAEFSSFRPFSPVIQSTSPIESPIRRETIVVPRAHRLLATRELATKIYREVYEDKWHPEDNPQGKIDLCTAENNLCEDLLEEKLNNPQTWSGAIQSLHHYSQSGGFDWVKQAATNYVERFISTVGDPGLLPENLTIVPGCRAAYDMIGFCLFEPGDAILTFAPFYSRLVDNFEERAQVRVVTAEFNNIKSPHLDIQALQTAFDEAGEKNIRVRALSIVNPHNPLGVVFNENEILEACKWAVSKNLFIIADEVFASTISCQEKRFRSLLSIRHQLGVKQRKKVIWMWSVSKDLCLPGARFGLVHTENKDLQKALRRLEILQPCAPIVQFLVGTLFSDIDWFTKFNTIKNERLQENRNFVTSKLDEYGIEYFAASAALFIFVNLSEYIEDETCEAEQKLWKRFTRAGVYLNPGFLLSSSNCGWFRLVISVPTAELEEGIKRLHAILLTIEKRQVHRKTSSPQPETPSQPISSATSEDELMKLIFTKDANLLDPSAIGELKDEDLLNAVFVSAKVPKSIKQKDEEEIEPPEIKDESIGSDSSEEQFEASIKLEDNVKVDNVESVKPESTLSDQQYESIFEPPRSTVSVIGGETTTIRQTSIIKESHQNQQENLLKTTIQEAQLPHQFSTTKATDSELKEHPKIDSQVKVQHSDSKTTTYISRPPQVEQAEKTKIDPATLLSDDIFDSIFPQKKHPLTKSTTTIQESESLVLNKDAELPSLDLEKQIDLPSTTKLQPFQQSVTSSNSEVVENVENVESGGRYTTSKHDSGIETDYKTQRVQQLSEGSQPLADDVYETIFETSQQREKASTTISEKQPLADDVYETIFETTAPKTEEKRTLSTVKADQDSQITTDLQAFSRRQNDSNVKRQSGDEKQPLADDVYETIFETSQKHEEAPTTKVVKADQDSQITTDLQAFSRQQHRISNPQSQMEATLPQEVIEEIFDPKIHQIYYTQSLPQMEFNETAERPLGERRISESLLEKVFQPTQQSEIAIPQSTTPKHQKSEKDSQLSTDFSAFARAQQKEDVRRDAPTLSDDVIERIFDPSHSDKDVEGEKTKELIESLWDTMPGDGAKNEDTKKKIDFRQSNNDHQITTDMSSFSRHQHLEQKREIGEPTLSDKEVSSILKQLWPRQSSGESSEVESKSEEQKAEQEVVVKEVHSPTFVQRFEYVDVQPHQFEGTRVQNEVKPDKLQVEEDVAPDDLLDIVFEQQGQEVAEKQQKREYKSARSEKDQQINDGLTFPKQVQQQRKQINEPTLTDDAYLQIFEAPKKEETPEQFEVVEVVEKTEKPAKKHVRIAEIEHEKIEVFEYAEPIRKAKELEEKPLLLKSEPEELENFEKYGTMLEGEKESGHQESQNKPDEFAKVFEDQDRQPSSQIDEFDDAYSIKPMLTDFSFIEDLVKESIQRRQKQQYRPEMDQYRLSLVEELSETSATPKGSSGSPISRRSLRDSLKKQGASIEEEELIEEHPINEDIFKEASEDASKDDDEVVEELRDEEVVEVAKEIELNKQEELVKEDLKLEHVEVVKETELNKAEEKLVDEFIDQIFEPINNQESQEDKTDDQLSPLPSEQMQPLHIDVNTEPLQSSTLRRGGHLQGQKQHEMNDSGIGMDMSSSGSMTIEFPLLYSSRHEATIDSTFTTEELKSLIDQPLDHWPKQKQETQENRPRFESLIKDEEMQQRTSRSLLKKSEQQQTPPIYSEADIWGILGTAQEKQDRHATGSLRQILKKKRFSESSGGGDETPEPKFASSMSTDSMAGSRKNSVDLNVRIRSISPSPLMSSQDEDRHSTTMQIGSKPKAKIYQRRHRPSSKSKASQQSSVSTIIDSYNKSVKGQKENVDAELFPNVKVTSHHRYVKSNIKQTLSRSEDPLLADASQVHHTMFMERRPKSLSPHSSRRVILEHTNITEIVYDSKDSLSDAKERPELVKTKASTRVNSLGNKELLNSLVFDTEKEPRHEKAERYVEFRRHRLRDKGQSKIRTSELHVQPDQSDSTSADDATDFQRTKSGRMQRGVQTRKDPVDLCCKMRLIQKEETEDKRKEFVMCRNPSHSGKHDHCNPKRLYIVKRSTIPRSPGDSKIQISADPHDILTISNSSDSNTSNSIDRVKIRHTPGSRWLVSSICKTTKYGFERKMLQPEHLKSTDPATIRSPVYNSD